MIHLLMPMTFPRGMPMSTGLVEEVVPLIRDALVSVGKIRLHICKGMTSDTVII